jgi:two-component system sensor histidine kinase DesK
MRLLPKDQHIGRVPYAWLIFLAFFFFHPIADRVGWQEWVATWLAVGIFLVFYFSIFWRAYPRNLLNLAGMVLVGMAMAPSNGGASVFFIYCASFIAWATPTAKQAFRLLAVLLGLIGLEAWLLHLPPGFWATALVVSIGVGVSNIHFAERNRANYKLRLAQEEIEHLAKVAERERIARDLHDVLGHTLSVIILKSELAGKLLERDPQRAKAEIADVERTSREALAEVRNTIRGYRAQSLEAELKQAQAALETAGVRVSTEAVPMDLTPTQESVVAMVVREAVTNVVRHAQARNCRLRLATDNGSCLLEIHDDGRGGSQIEGNGLRGMRERIEALGGTLERDTSAGTRLKILFPVAHPK